MVNPLSKLENLAEQLVESTLERALGARVQPIQVARRIGRAMEDGQVINTRGEIVVPNEYQVALHPSDLAALQNYQDALRDELTRYVANLARKAGATMVGRPRVTLQADPGVTPRSVRVQAQVIGAPRGGANFTHTMALPSTGGPAAPTEAPTLTLFDGYRRMPISEAVVSIGRSLDNDIILDDPRVSRKHAQLRRRFGQYILYDLNSTGGTTVNGQAVREAALQPGDTLTFAGVIVRLETAAPATANVAAATFATPPAAMPPASPPASPDATRMMPPRRPRGGGA